MTISDNAFHCKIVFCSIIRKNQLSEVPLVLISSDNWRSTVLAILISFFAINIAMLICYFAICY